MRNSFVLLFLLGCFCLGISALKCNVCDGKGCTKQKEQECDSKYDRCLDVGYYGRSYLPIKSRQYSIRKIAQVDKLCADAKLEEKMCKRTEKKGQKGFCKSCKEDLCNKETNKEITDHLEKAKKEKHEKKAAKKDAKREKKAREEEKKKLKHQKKQEKEERKKGKIRAEHDKDVKKESMKKLEKQTDENKKKEKTENKKAQKALKNEAKAEANEKQAKKIEESLKQKEEK